MHYADSWYCNENCLFEYIKENEAELAGMLDEEENEEKISDDEGDLNYDPMDDF